MNGWAIFKWQKQRLRIARQLTTILTLIGKMRALCWLTLFRKMHDRGAIEACSARGRAHSAITEGRRWGLWGSCRGWSRGR
jgi:hypothetical protein